MQTSIVTFFSTLFIRSFFGGIQIECHFSKLQKKSYLGQLGCAVIRLDAVETKKEQVLDRIFRSSEETTC